MEIKVTKPARTFDLKLTEAEYLAITVTVETAQPTRSYEDSGLKRNLASAGIKECKDFSNLIYGIFEKLNQEV